MREFLFKYVLECIIKDRIEIVYVVLTLDELEMYTDKMDMLFERADDKLKDLYGYECHCLNENQTFCECDSILDDFKVIDRSQATGLKDKNGEMIFEGDILISEFKKKIRIIDGKESFSPGFCKCVVSFENGSFGYNIVEQENYYFGELPSRFESLMFKDMAKFEIIGNIHDKG